MGKLRLTNATLLCLSFKDHPLSGPNPAPTQGQAHDVLRVMQIIEQTLIPVIADLLGLPILCAIEVLGRAAEAAAVSEHLPAGVKRAHPSQRAGLRTERGRTVPARIQNAIACRAP